MKFFGRFGALAFLALSLSACGGIGFSGQQADFYTGLESIWEMSGAGQVTCAGEEMMPGSIFEMMSDVADTYNLTEEEARPVVDQFLADHC